MASVFGRDNMNRHTELRKAFKKARELSIQHRACPYLLSYKPQIKKTGVTKTHTHQATADRINKAFAIVRARLNIYTDLPEGKSPPPFHEVRGLAINQLLKAVIGGEL